jgi:hypothetical protein
MPLSPTQGPSGGGTTVSITGSGLANASAVHFGPNLAIITANTDTSVTVVSPSGCGAVDVTVTTPGGTSDPLSYFYIGAPFLAGLSADNGPTAGGNTVTLTGTGLSTASVVHFGANTATPTVVNDGQLTVAVPAGTAAGTVAVSVTTVGGTDDGLSYTYVDAPTITDFNPTSGPPTGGTSVTITGTSLSTAQSVTFGGLAAAFEVVNDSTISATTPPTADGAPGPATLTVTTAGGSASAANPFNYVAGPSV